MKIKLTLTRGDKKELLITNLFAISEWERLENRRVSDGRGIGASDMACWAYIMLGIKGETLPATWREWLKQNPVPKNPVGAPTWEEMSDKERLSHMTSIIISVPITCAMFYALGQFLIDLLRSMP